jgi:integrase
VAYQKRDISSINYQRMINDEAVADVSAKTLSNAFRLVSASLHHVGAEVPVVKLPKIPKASRPWLDYEQIETFMTAIKDKPVELAALLALNGLRRSELFHLTSDDVDLQNHIIHVRGASVYDSNGQFVTKATNKNASSTREVHIVIPRLETLLNGLVGALVTVKPNTPYIEINRICKAVGLPQVGVHGLRHSFASLAYHLGWSEATTMREGGWSNSKTVHDIYTHLAAQDANADIERMRQFYTTEKPKTAPSHSKSVAMKNPTKQKSE